MASITDQNWVVWNQGKNPLVNFNFMLRVELAVDLPCKSVRAFSRELEYDYIQEGGLNDYVHMRRKPITRPFTLEIERYVGVDYLDPLPLGTDLTLPVLLFVSRNHDQFIPGVVARTYVFTGCTVMKKTYGDLVADQSGLLVETTTLGYREMLCVDIPWSEVGDNISKDVKTVPTAARTLDKSAAELKALGNELYLQAKAAKEQAETELSAQDAQALIDELTSTLADLRAAVDKGGSLVQAADRAEAGRNGAGGHPKTELADQAQAAAQQAEKDFRAKEQLAQEANAALYRAEDALRQAKEAVDGPEGRVKDLTAQLEQDAADRKALEDKLPENIRTAAAAQTAVAAAQQARNEAEEALAAAQQAKQDAIAQAQQKEDYAPAREKAAQTAKALTAAQQERDQAAQAADTARREYEAALRTWQEHQNDQLERAAARTGSYEDQLRIAQDGLKSIQRQMDRSRQTLAALPPPETAAPEDEATREQETARLAQLEQEQNAAQAKVDAAQAEVDQAKAEEKAVQDAAQAGPQDGRVLDCKEALDAAEEQQTRAEKALAAAQAEDETAQSALQAGLDKESEAVAQGELGQAVTAAQAAFTAAQAALDAAQSQHQTCRELEALQARIDQHTQELEEAKQEVQSIRSGDLAQAEQATAAAKTARDQARNDLDQAAAARDAAQQAAQTARDAAAQAEQVYNQAQAELRKANRQVNPLQNSLTNLKLRKDPALQAQKDCTAQHDLCRQANDALQAMPDDDLPQVNTGYESVKKLSKQTCFHQRQVRELCQYMENARRLLDEVQLPAAE